MPRASSASRSLGGHRRPPRKQCTKVEDTWIRTRRPFREGETVGCDLMLVSVGRAPLVEGIGLQPAGVAFDPRTGVETDAHRRTSCRTSMPPVAGYWQLAHTAFREGEIAAENATGHEAPMPRRPFRGRSTRTPRSPASALRKPRPASGTATRTSPWAGSWCGERARRHVRRSGGWVKTIHETTYGELIGVVIVGAHATDLIEAAVVALDAELDDRDDRRRDGSASHLGEGGRSQDRSYSVERSIFRRDGSRRA